MLEVENKESFIIFSLELENIWGLLLNVLNNGFLKWG